MAFTVLSDKASHFLDVTRCDQWGLLYVISTQRCLWDMNSCQTELPRLGVPPLKQTFAFATHALLFQIVFTQTALLRKKIPAKGDFSTSRLQKSATTSVLFTKPFTKGSIHKGVEHYLLTILKILSLIISYVLRKNMSPLYKVKHNGYKNACLIIVNSLLLSLQSYPNYENTTFWSNLRVGLSFCKLYDSCMLTAC